VSLFRWHQHKVIAISSVFSCVSQKVLDQPNLDHRCLRGIPSQSMFRMLNLAYISPSSDFEIFLLNMKTFFFF